MLTDYTVLQLYGGGTGQGARNRGEATLCSARRMPCVADDGTAHLMTSAWPTLACLPGLPQFTH